jgi:hypothetical protein
VLVEREGRGAPEQRIGGGLVLGVGGFPQRWANDARGEPSARVPRDPA